jgi:short-subunit dehydrogenase
MNPKGKVAIVTGASSGIGKATATLLAQKGAIVVSVSRHGLVVADMTKPRDIERFVRNTVKRFGRIDILVNNAGRGYDAAIEYTDPKRLQEIFTLDVVGPLIAMQRVIPVMRKTGGGSIVNISSATALMHLPNMGGYAALKHALADLSLTANEELKKDHISVSVIYPYITDTNFEKNTLKGKEIRVSWDGGGKIPSADPPEHIAKLILQAIETGKPEFLAHEWIRKMVR